MNTLRRFAPFLLLVGAVFASYGNVWSFSFLYDDEFLLQKNTYLSSFDTFFQIFNHSSTGGAGFTDSFYRPFQIVAYLFTEQLFGKETWAFHFLNVALHSLNACLLFLLARRIGLSKLAATGAALLWAVHPVHVEAITYMSGTADPLATCFTLAGLLVIRDGRDWRRVAIGAVAFICALLSKESSIVFPGLVMVMLFLERDDRWKLKTYLPSIPLWLVAFGYLACRATLLNFDSDFTMYKFDNAYSHSLALRIYTFLSTLPDYLNLLIWPHDLQIDRDYPVATTFWSAKPVIGFILLLAPAICFYRCWKEKASPWMAWIALWFLAAYGPSSGVLVPVNSLFLEHWLYLPSMSLFIGLAHGWDKITKATLSRVALAFAAVAAAAFSVATFRQNFVWESPITLYTHILKYNVAAGRIHHNLAMAYEDAGRKEDAMKEYQFIIDHGGKFPQTYHNLAQIYFNQGQLDLAEKYEKMAIEVAPKFHPPYVGLSKIYQARGDSAKAAEYYQKAVELVH